MTQAEPASVAPQSEVIRFGVFELDLGRGQLRKAGAVVRLPPQPLKLLGLLAGRGGDLVSREEIRQQLWGGETFVDFDQGVNFSIKQIRTALGDDASRPLYIETVPRRGYRFVAPVERVAGDSLTPSARRRSRTAIDYQFQQILWANLAELQLSARRTKHWMIVAAIVALTALALTAWLAWVP